MEAVEKTLPTMIHLLRPLITKRLETLKLNSVWDKRYQLSKEEKSQYRESATNLLHLTVAQKSVFFSS